MQPNCVVAKRSVSTEPASPLSAGRSGERPEPTVQPGWENAEAWGATGDVSQCRGWCVSLGIAPKAEGPWGMLLKGRQRGEERVAGTGELVAADAWECA
jgi:hypothetical protein